MIHTDETHALDVAQLAKRWGKSIHTLNNWRCKGNGPAYRKIGNKIIYLLEDVIEFENQNKRSSTSQSA